MGVDICDLTVKPSVQTQGCRIVHGGMCRPKGVDICDLWNTGALLIDRLTESGGMGLALIALR